MSLYHGTDRRILLLPENERKAIKDACIVASSYLWPIFKPYVYESVEVPIPQMPGCKTSISKFETLISSFPNKIELLNVLQKAEANANGSPLYQYDSFYVTTDKNRAITYAKNSYAFGEIGFVAYKMRNCALELRLKEYQPKGKTREAIEIISGFANQKPEPVLIEICDYDISDLRMENGMPLRDGVLGPGIGISLRYMRDINNVVYSIIDIH